MELCITRPTPKTSLRRDWRHYSKERLEQELNLVDWSNEATTVQDVWNDSETKLICIVDSLIPMSEFVGSKFKDVRNLFIHRKIYLRNAC